MNTVDDGALAFESLLKNDRFLAAIRENERRIKGMSDNVEKEGGRIDLSFQKMGKFASELIGPVSAAVAVFKFKQLAQEAYEFEKAYGMAMREVQTISKAVQDNLEGISDRIANIAANGPDDAIKLAKAFYQIVSAGYDGEAGLKLLEISSKAATAGITDTVIAADGLTTVLNAWGISAKYAEKVADVMFKTVERGKTTFLELASNIAQVAPLAASNNIAFEQIFAALQTITKQGTPTAQAMTQIRSSIINMNKVLGDGWSDTMTYQEGLQKIAEMAGGSQNKLKELIPDVEGVNAVLALTGEKAKGAAEDLDETTKAAGAMETAYERMMLEAENRWSVIHNKWTRELRDLGKALKEGSGYISEYADAVLSKGVDIDKNLAIYNISDKIKAFRIMGDSMVSAYAKAGITPLAEVRRQYGEFVKSITEYANQGLSGQQTSLNDILKIDDKTEKLNKLNEFLAALKKSEQDLGNTVFTNDQQQAAALKLRADLWGEVKARAEEAITAIQNEGSGGGGTEAKVRTLKNMLDDLKDVKEKLGTGTLEEDIELVAQMSNLVKEIQAYNDKLVKFRNDLTTGAISPLKQNTFSGEVKVIKEANLEFDKLNKRIEENRKKAAKMQGVFDADQLRDFLEEFYKIGYYANEIGKELESWGGPMGEFGKMLSGAVGNMDNFLAAMDKSASKGERIAAGVEGLVDLVGIVINSAKARKEAEQQYYDSVIDQQQQYNLLLNDQLRLQSEMSDNVFTTDYKGRITSGIEALSDASKNYSDSLKALTDGKAILGQRNAIDWGNVGAGLGSGAAAGAAIGSIVPVIGTAVGAVVGGIVGGLTGLFGGKKKKDVLGDLLSEYPELIEKAANGQDKLNVSLAQTLIDQKLVNDETSQALQNAIEWTDKMEEAQQQIEAVIKDLAGSLGNDLSNALVTAFEEGEDAAKAFGESVSKVLENVIQQMVFDQVFGNLFDDLQERMTASFDLGGDQNWIDDFGWFFEQTPDLINQGMKALADAKEQARLAGLDIFSSDSSKSSGLTGSIQRSLTEETAGELAGLMRKTSDDTRQLKDYGKLAVENLVKIEENTANTVNELKNTVSELKTSNEKLEKIINNTTQSTTGRDLGIG